MRAWWHDALDPVGNTRGQGFVDGERDEEVWSTRIASLEGGVSLTVGEKLRGVKAKVKLKGKVKVKGCRKGAVDLKMIAFYSFRRR